MIKKKSCSLNTKETVLHSVSALFNALAFQASHAKN